MPHANIGMTKPYRLGISSYQTKNRHELLNHADSVEKDNWRAHKIFVGTARQSE
jgi:hypothetical protein